jgi:hypothetical protein
VRVLVVDVEELLDLSGDLDRSAAQVETLQRTMATFPRD